MSIDSAKPTEQVDEYRSEGIHQRVESAIKALLPGLRSDNPYERHAVASALAALDQYPRAPVSFYLGKIFDRICLRESWNQPSRQDELVRFLSLLGEFLKNGTELNKFGNFYSRVFEEIEKIPLDVQEQLYRRPHFGAIVAKLWSKNYKAGDQYALEILRRIIRLGDKEAVEAGWATFLSRRDYSLGRDYRRAMIGDDLIIEQFARPGPHNSDDGFLVVLRFLLDEVATFTPGSRAEHAISFIKEFALKRGMASVVPELLLLLQTFPDHFRTRIISKPAVMFLVAKHLESIAEDTDSFTDAAPLIRELAEFVQRDEQEETFHHSVAKLLLRTKSPLIHRGERIRVANILLDHQTGESRELAVQLYDSATPVE